MRNRLLLWMMLLIAPFSLAAGAEVISFDTDNPPFMYKDGGKAMGLYPVLVAAVFKHMQTKVVLQARPWKRAFDELDRGQSGVGGLYKNGERALKYDFSAPLFVEKILVYYNTAYPLQITKIQDLAGLRVGVLRGWSYGEEFDRARAAKVFSVEETASDRQNLRKLDLGRLDAVLAVEESGLAQQRGLPGLRVASSLLLQNSTYLAFAKSAQKQDLLRRFDQALSELKRSGDFSRIVASELTRQR